MADSSVDRLTSEGLLGLHDALEAVGLANVIPRSTAYGWASRGVGGCKLECVKIGGAILTSLPALRRFLAKCAESRTELGNAGNFNSLSDVVLR